MKFREQSKRFHSNKQVEKHYSIGRVSRRLKVFWRSLYVVADVSSGSHSSVEDCLVQRIYEQQATSRDAHDCYRLTD